MYKQIAFTYSWRDTLKIALIAGVMILFIMVFLQPFDTFQSTIQFKFMKLSGYSFVIIIPILFFHFVERFWYEKQNYRWTLLNEVVSLISIFTLTSICSYFYHHLLFQGSLISFSNSIRFLIYYCLPFLPLFLPLLSYFRFTFGKVVITGSDTDQNNNLEIAGDNKDEKISIPMTRFIYAEAQQNYVDLYFLGSDHKIEKEIIRSTFSNIVDQIPEAYQVHRSYLINPDFLSQITGNTRKRLIELKGVENQIPVSKKYYQAIEKHLQNRP